MKAYFFVMVGCLILGVLVMFAFVLFGDQPVSDVGKPAVVDEPAGTKNIPQPEEVAECHADSDCEIGLECFRGQCSYPCRGALMCPVGMVCSATRYCEGHPACPDYGPEICDGLDNDCDGVIDEEVCPGPVERLFLNPASPFWIGP
ncbi:putative metal-binding motif-containing protein [Candidatus Falkowbacteria bacterium]|nr:putative metal-binding motif-containing protein [Candidatus Falkowbacteria bacterium]